MCITFLFIFTQTSDKIQKLLNSCSADILTPSEYYQRFPRMFPGFPKVAECSSAKHQILAPYCQDHAYLAKITKMRYRETLRWLDTVFQGQYLPRLSINYVAINKDLEKLTPHHFFAWKLNSVPHVNSH